MASHRNDPGGGLTRERLRAFWKIGEQVVVFGGVALLVVVSIPGMSDVLEGFNIDTSEITVGVVLPVILVGVYSRLLELSKDASAEHAVRQRLDPSPELGRALLECVMSTKRKEDKTVRALGLTLSAAWPQIRDVLDSKVDDGLLDGWTIEFSAYMNPGSNGAHEQASRTSEDHLRSITLRAQDAKVKKRGVTLSAFTYSFEPTVHGFRFNNGALFISFLRRNQDGPALENFTYEYLPAADHSLAAEAMRELFDSWWAAAATPYVPATGSSSSS